MRSTRPHHARVRCPAHDLEGPRPVHRVRGEVTIGQSVQDSSVTVEIEAASVNTDSEQRDGHLRGEDFFDVENYPNLTFTSTGLRVGEGSGFELDGELTIKDVTNPVTLQGEFLGCGPGLQGGTLAAFSAQTTINREDWDLTWNVAVETGGSWSARTSTSCSMWSLAAGGLEPGTRVVPRGAARASAPPPATLGPCAPRSSS